VLKLLSLDAVGEHDSVQANPAKAIFDHDAIKKKKKIKKEKNDLVFEEHSLGLSSVRVTRLGDFFSSIGRLSTLGSILKITEADPIYVHTVFILILIIMD
jgi:hypothetical protein